MGHGARLHVQQLYEQRGQGAVVRDDERVLTAREQLLQHGAGARAHVLKALPAGGRHGGPVREHTGHQLGELPQQLLVALVLKFAHVLLCQALAELYGHIPPLQGQAGRLRGAAEGAGQAARQGYSRELGAQSTGLLAPACGKREVGYAVEQPPHVALGFAVAGEVEPHTAPPSPQTDRPDT